MAAIAQDLLVALIVAGCAIFSAWRLMSPRVRLKTLEWLTPVATKIGASGALTRLRTRKDATLSSP